MQTKAPTMDANNQPVYKQFRYAIEFLLNGRVQFDRIEKSKLPELNIFCKVCRHDAKTVQHLK